MSLQLGIEQFNQRKFYECHDTLEAVWIEAPEMDKRFYQGILQVAVACHHLSNLNLRGAIILLGEAVRRLNDYQPDYYDVDVSQLMTESIELLQTLQQINSDRLEDLVSDLFAPEDVATEVQSNLKLPKITLI